MQLSEREKEQQLQTLLYTLKILAVFFCAIPIFQRLFGGESMHYMLENNKFAATLPALVVLAAILLLVLLICYGGKKRSKLHIIAEIFIFFALFLCAIFFSGVNESYYKFLFIFLIVSCTIEYSLKVGLLICAISSGLIICIDLFSAGKSAVNVYFENDLALSAMFLTVALVIGVYSQLQKQHIAYLQLDANTDGLTQVFNHRYFYQILQTTCQQAVADNSPISLLMVDIDYFKIYNDVYGHQQGDAVLKELVQLLKDCLLPQQILCRYGGEEFGIILPDTTVQAALQLGDEIRQKVEQHHFWGESALPEHTLSVSVGVDQLRGPQDNFNHLVNRADQALYRAKYLRRNRVEVYTSIIDRYYSSEHSQDQLGETDLHTMKTLIGVINSKDSYTYNHIDRVVNYCDIFALYLNLKEEERKTLIYAAYLHDLGKINIDKEILITSQKLTQQQWDLLKLHPTDGANIVRDVGCSKEIASIIEQHHERIDGKGYPKGLTKEQIHPLARMLSIADSFDAMTNARPYNSKKTFEEGFLELEQCAGTQFDKELAHQFVTAMKQLKSN